MTLYNTRTPYTIIDARLLRVKSKITILAAIDLFRGGYLSKALQRDWTPYEIRQQNQIQRELQDRGIITDESESSGIPRRSYISDADRVAIPTQIAYEEFTLGELKTYIACHYRVRHGRKPYFQFTCTHTDLADDAHLSRRNIQDALVTLQAKRLIQTKKEWRKGTQFRLLDPDSGASLYHLGLFYAQRLDCISPLDRYKLSLKGYDPREQLESITGWISGHQVLCPFCPKPERTFRFTATEDEDHWKCFSCGRSGDSARLFTLRQWKIGKVPFEVTIATIADAIDGTPTASYDPLGNPRS
jgi:CHC2 zinc finger